VFTGCRTSVNPIKCYWANAFLIQGENKKQVNLNPFGQWVNIKMNFDLALCSKYRNYAEISKHMENYKEGDNLINEIKAKSNSHFIKFAKPYSKNIPEKDPP